MGNTHKKNNRGGIVMAELEIQTIKEMAQILKDLENAKAEAQKELEEVYKKYTEEVSKQNRFVKSIKLLKKIAIALVKEKDFELYTEAENIVKILTQYS